MKVKKKSYSQFAPDTFKVFIGNEQCMAIKFQNKFLFLRKNGLRVSRCFNNNFLLN